MSFIQIKMFGKLSIRAEGQDWTTIHSQNVCELFCYLLLHQSHPQNREHLAEIFWAEGASVQSKKYLRKSLWLLQRELRSRIGRDVDRILIVEPEWLQINPEANLWVDAMEFARRYDVILHLAGREMDRGQFMDTQKAVDLYDSELLEGWYQEWCLVERERYREMYLTMLERLMEYCEVHHDYEEAVIYGAKILELDPTQERIHLRLMKLKYLMKDRISAIHQYFRCRNILAEELGVEPGGELQEFYGQISQGAIANKGNIGTRESRDDFAKIVGFQESLKLMAAMVSDQENILTQLMNEVKKMQTELEYVK